MSGMEIERKFLVHKAGRRYEAEAFSHSHIHQGYICSAKGRTVRVRMRDNRAFLTIKGPSDASGTSRYEFEKEIAQEEALRLFDICEPGQIDKTRFLVRSGKHVFEIDEFHGDNAGLVMAEVELESEDEPFTKPDFIADEVTGDRRFYNSCLTKEPFCQWKGSLPEEFR